MNEQTWPVSADYRGMMDPLYLRSDRKQRLFAVACARLVLPHLPDPVIADAMDAAERFADGEASPWTLRASYLTVPPLEVGVTAALSRAVTQSSAWDAATSAGEYLRLYFDNHVAADLLRSIVGNPFSPVREVLPRQGGMIMLDAWQGGIYHFPEQPALAMAQAAYEHRQDNGRLDPVLLAILSDVLEDHGLPDAVLQALPGPRASYRGLWALDLILDRE